nr:ORF IIB satellite RNA5 [Cucumber mosaic virus]
MVGATPGATFSALHFSFEPPLSLLAKPGHGSPLLWISKETLC